jgi:hypothetical protein
MPLANADLEHQRPNSKEKHGVWDPMSEFSMTSPYHIYHRQPYAGVDFNTMPESTLSRCQGLRILSQISSTMEGTMQRAVLWVQNGLVRILLFRIVPDPYPNPFNQAN